MINLNLIGYIGQDAVVNSIGGKTVINVNICHTEKYKDKSGTEISKSIWVIAAWWTDKTTIAQYLKKGTQVYVTGIPDARAYTNQQGQTVAQLTLRVSSIQLLGSTQSRNENAPPSYQQQESNVSSSDDSDSLPF